MDKPINPDLKRAFEHYPATLDTNQTAEILGVDKTTVTRYARMGLKAYRASSKKQAPFRFLKIDVLRYMDGLRFNP